MVSLQSQPTYWKVRTKILKNSVIFNKLNLLVLLQNTARI